MNRLFSVIVRFDSGVRIDVLVSATSEVEADRLAQEAAQGTHRAEITSTLVTPVEGQTFTYAVYDAA